MITTKRGKIGAPQVKMSAYVGFSKLGKKIDALNTEQYKDLMKDLKAVSDVAPNIPESETRYVDWTDYSSVRVSIRTISCLWQMEPRNCNILFPGVIPTNRVSWRKHISIGIISVQTWIVSRPNG